MSLGERQSSSCRVSEDVDVRDATDEEGTEIYCLCRTTKGKDEFMICCDGCEVWFHGSCVKIDVSHSDKIDKYYCDACLDKDSSLRRIVLKKKISRNIQKEKDQANIFRCDNCIGCLRKEACGKCEACTDTFPYPKDEHPLCQRMKCVQAPVLSEAARSSGRTRRLLSTLSTEDDSDGGFSPPPLSSANDSAAATSAAEPEKKKRGRKKGWRKEQAKVTAGKIKQEDDDESSSPRKPVKEEEDEYTPESSTRKQKNDPKIQKEFIRGVYAAHSRRRGRPLVTKAEENCDPPKQCLGPQCIQQTRIGSKYCSDICGMKLARERIREILPGRVNDYWLNTPRAEVRDHAQLQEIDDKIKKWDDHLAKLRTSKQLLKRYIESLKNITPSPDEDEDELDGGSIACCTMCGVEYSSRQLAKHVERCFVKTEKQTSFGTLLNEHVDNDLFCNEQNKTTKIYCRRVRVMCPEHYKGEEEKSITICGCPKKWGDSLSSLSLSEMYTSAADLLDQGCCFVARKDCSKHHRWVQTALGVIDCSTITILQLKSELFDRRSLIARTMKYRGDAITLLCNETESHEDNKKSE